MLDVKNAHGFCADPGVPTWMNLKNYYRCMSPIDFLGRPHDGSFHNLCKQTPIPTGTKSLLNMGLKFCPTRPRPTNNLNKTFKRFRRDVRRAAYHHFNPPRKRPGIRYIPGLYISQKWNAPDRYPAVERCLDDFERHLRRRCLSYQKRLSLTNLTPRQWSAAEKLRENDIVITTETDKNLGGATIPRPVYNTAGIREHLGDEAVYKRLSKIEAVSREKVLRARILRFINHYKRDISPAEFEFLDTAYSETRGRISKFRMTPKVHKKPWKMRPIVCCCGTLLNHLSRWLDYHFQKLRPLVKSYIKDSAQFLARLRELQQNGQLPLNIWVFTADARSMYTNIDTEHALKVIGEWLDKLRRDGLLPADFPLEAVKEAMALVMQNNVFEWGDLYFLQLLGTAMGTSAACMWATIYFGVYEDDFLAAFSNNLLLYCRFIDDISGVWIGHRNSMAWAQFKERCNDFGLLEWDFSELSKSVNFLDLTIYIKDGFILTKTYQKPMNLYHYISPSSNHPPKMIEGIIYSLLRTYKLQNTMEKDYIDVARLLHERHVARGWDHNHMRRLILEADFKLRQNPPTLPAAVTPAPPDPALYQNKKTDRVFLHFEYGRNDLPRNIIRSIYNMTCKEMCEGIGLKDLTIAYSRPKNIKDLVTKAKLHMAPGKEASKYYLGELSAEREL